MDAVKCYKYTCNDRFHFHFHFQYTLLFLVHFVLFLRAVAAVTVPLWWDTDAFPAEPAAARVRTFYNVSMKANITVGTPPVARTVSVDTGSELTWLTCHAGSSAGYGQGVSATFRALSCGAAECTGAGAGAASGPFTACAADETCRFDVVYADGTEAAGVLARDAAAIAGSALPAAIVLGCANSSFLQQQKKNSSASEGAGDAGILGLNRGSLSLIQQMGRFGYRRRFGYCISGDAAVAGALVLGEAVPGKLSFTAMVSVKLPLPYFDRDAYSVGLRGVRVGTKMLPLAAEVLRPDHSGAGQTMIDSGTQFTFLLGGIYKPLREEFANQTQALNLNLTGADWPPYQGVLDLCYKIPTPNSTFPLAKLPTVGLLFDSAEMSVDGRRLFFDTGNGVYCFTFGNADAVPVEANIIGNYHQQGVWMQFDLDAGLVGFETTTSAGSCSAT